MAVADKRELNQQLNSSHGSFELVVSPLVLGLLGWWLDSKLDSGPWLTIVFAVFGIAGACAKLYFDYTARMQQLQTQARANRASAP